ncbi:MAG: integration host factor subunit beta [Acidobacteria bacterium]|nr:integration host factor subunit beta [Acidobacteriota bacterium]
MTKADLVEKVSTAASLSKSEAEAVVKTVLDAIVDALNRGEKVELRGFGSFRLRKRRPRQGRNPKTGSKVEVPGKAVPYFKPGKELRELLNPGDLGEDFDPEDALDHEDSAPLPGASPSF